MILKPSLLIATDSFLPTWDGITRFLLETVPHLQNRFDVTIACPSSKEPVKYTEATLLRLPAHGRRVTLSGLFGAISDSSLVFVQSFGPVGMYTLKEATRLKRRTFAYMHTIPWQQCSPYRLLNTFRRSRQLRHFQKILNQTSGVLVSSESLAHQLEQDGITVPKIIVPVGVDTNAFTPSPSPDTAKERLNIDKNMKVIGYVGNFSTVKNVQTVYRAFKQLQTQYPNVFLLMVGQGNKRLEKKLRKDGQCRLVKSTNNSIPYYQAMDIFVHPSLAETSAISALEAMSCGVPVVSSGAGDMSRYIIDKQNGIFYPTLNDAVLSIKLGWLINEEFVRKAIGAAGRKTASAYPWAETNKTLLRIFEGA